MDGRWWSDFRWDTLEDPEAIEPYLDLASQIVRARGVQAGLVEPTGLWRQRWYSHLESSIGDCYIRDYAASDPRWVPLLQAPGRLHPDWEIVPEQEFEHSRLCREMLVPEGARHSVAAAVPLVSGALFCVGVMRPKDQGPYSDGETQALTTWLATGRSLFNSLERNRALVGQELWSLEQLDRRPEACFVLDDQQRILLANRAAQSLLNRRRWVEVVQGRWRFRSARLMGWYRATLNRVSILGLGDPPDRIALSSPSDLPAVAEVTQDSRHTVTVRIFELKVDGQDRLAELAKVWGLTPAESLVAEGLFQGQSLTALASHLGKSRDTVKSQFQALAAKLGLHRQTEVVAWLATALRTFD